MQGMRVVLCEPDGHRRQSISVQSDALPVVIKTRDPHGQVREHYMNWDRAFDDEDHLRACPACGCNHLYVRKTCPPLTGFIIVLAVGLICLLLWGLTDAPVTWVLVALGVVTVANLAIVYLAPVYGCCYQCHSRYYDVSISRQHRTWSAADAERYQPTPQEENTTTEMSGHGENID